MDPQLYDYIQLMDQIGTPNSKFALIAVVTLFVFLAAFRMLSMALTLIYAIFIVGVVPRITITIYSVETSESHIV